MPYTHIRSKIFTSIFHLSNVAYTYEKVVGLYAYFLMIIAGDYCDRNMNCNCNCNNEFAAPFLECANAICMYSGNTILQRRQFMKKGL